MKNFFKKIVFAMAALLTINLTAQAQDKDALVDIKNGKLHAVVTGDGPYTVVFEAGFISDLSVWRKVAPTVAKQAQILVYSRAGVGKSPARSQPLNLLQHTEELQQLIAALDLKKPLILVGHSYGGWVVRQFASAYPQQVAGLVLVDPANETLEIELRKIDAAKVTQDQQRFAGMAPPSAKADLALVQAIFDEGKLPNQAALPDVPMAILSSVQEFKNNPFFQETAVALKVKRNLHATLTDLFSNATHVVTNRSGHHIQNDEPHLVINAIEQIISGLNIEAQKIARQQAKQQARQAVMSALGQAGTELQNQQSEAAKNTVFTALKTSQFSEGEINQLGFDVMTKGKQPLMAEFIFRFNVEQFTQSDNVYDSHGEALLELGRFAEAKTQFTKAISLAQANPQRSPKTIKGYQDNLAKAEQALLKK
ncbi:alpha/beta fold hydrolase [Undibacterium amnicola]|uniref:Alpha/beta fold hydrolase n=1 Tax=Undibacterium amnicola TaxID=1834038 RepID=A0ABR6XRU1_9BURK|nr:alpha/beta hydrolase [Undibacterium amnicola]MBC3832198.1 alpha/beta fold hydrolase [Undibacterium amnicola]